MDANAISSSAGEGNGAGEGDGAGQRNVHLCRYIVFLSSCLFRLTLKLREPSAPYLHLESVDAVVDEKTPERSGSAPFDRATPEFWMTMCGDNDADNECADDDNSDDVVFNLLRSLS